MCIKPPPAPKMQNIAPPPPPVDAKEQAEAVKRAQDSEQKRKALAKGRQSTLLTSPLGDTSQAQTTNKTLLGS